MLKSFFVRPVRALYDRTLQLSTHPKAVWWLVLVAFTESIFFPIPQDVLLIPMMLSNRHKALYYATVCLIASTLGGIAGYLLGYYVFLDVAQPMLEAYGYAEAVAQVRNLYGQYGWLIVVIGGFTPLPYKVICITSGMMEMDFIGFVLAALVSRAARFYLFAFITYYFGEKILQFIDKYFTTVSIASTLLLVGGFLLFKGIV